MKKLTLIMLLLALFTLSACGVFDEREKPLVMASLFPQYDMAQQIGGEYVDVEFLLPPGVDAHSYEPTPRKVMEIIDADLLIYTGDMMEPWVPRLIQQNNGSGLKLLDLSQNIELISAQTTRQAPTNGEVPDYAEETEDEIGVFEILSYDDLNEVLAYVHIDHWHGSLPTIPVSDVLNLSAEIVSSDGQERPLDATDANDTLGVSIRENMPEDIVSVENHGDHVSIIAKSTGITQLEFHWIHDEKIRYTTPPINIQVGESDEPAGLLDPHIWMDPLNAIQMVEDIRDMFIDLLPEHESYFTENANNYIDELEAVHEAYKQLVEYSELDVMMHGGHNAFGYLTNRYNLSYVNPYRGFSADAEPTPQALADMIDLMQEKNINHLFSEVLIDPKVAEAIESETQATILMLYAGENMPLDKLEEGFSFIDVLYHNLEKLKIGLNYDGP